MQTFLPYPDFTKTFECLDFKRLGKQRVEARQIINIINGSKTTTTTWRHHPAVKMWEGYLPALKEYYNSCVSEWIKRGYVNNMLIFDITEEIVYPWWLGNEDFHRAMRAKLIDKAEKFYLPKFPEDKRFNNAQYFWPVNETRTFRMIPPVKRYPN